MSRQMIGPFQVEDRIGIGGMGIVYRAIYTKNGAPVALKILSPDVSDSESLQRRFEREISILKKLRHPNIVRYYGGGKFGSQRFYAMELIEGGSLEAYLKQKTRLPWEEALDITMQVARALQHAHEAGVIHRDLKPANLLKTTENVIKLTDFGIARDTTATAITAAGKTVGTYAYMAPEQIRGKPPVDKKTDMYAMGCVLFEMIAGETPFTSENQGEMLMQHLQEEPPRITSLVPDCPIFVEDLIFRLLEKEPEDRIFDAMALQSEIENVRTKITEQRSIATQTLAMGTTGGKSKGADELKGIVGKKKKKKKKENVPFYERVWFLGLCLLLLGGLVAWSFAPYSEQQLMDLAKKSAASEFTGDWKEAKQKYLDPLLQRFPNGKFAEQAELMKDELDKKITNKEMHNARRSKDGLLNEAEKKMLEAERFNEFGDRFTAREKYIGITRYYRDDPKYRTYVLLAQDRINEIKTAEGEGYVAYLNGRLKDADALMRRGKEGAARDIWDSIKTLYKGNKEVQSQVNYATKSLDGEDPGTAPWIDADETTEEK